MRLDESKRQGQRTLNRLAEQDFGEEAGVPAGHASLHDEAVLFAGVLFEQTQGESAEQSQVLGGVSVACSTFVLAELHAIALPLKSAGRLVCLEQTYVLIPSACSNRVPRPGSDRYAGLLLMLLFDFLAFFLDNINGRPCALVLVGST